MPGGLCPLKLLSIVGIGPGDPNQRTPLADAALSDAEELVGYGLYLDLLGDRIAGKRCHRLPLGDEQVRARLALERAASGCRVALISSGDAGIYAMASLVFELLDQDPSSNWDEVTIEVVPGISAVQATASRVGAPLGHDFCTVSLSDLLTPWETIARRLHGAGSGDFVVALFNPVSHRRRWQLEKARDILLEYRRPETPTVLGRNICRSGESTEIIRLDELSAERVDMLTLIIVGNRDTRRAGRWVYTPRGYGLAAPPKTKVADPT